MSSIHIRKADPTDAKELSNLICENAEALLRSHYNDEQWNVFISYYSEQALTEKIAKQAVFCAEKDGQILGTIALDEDFVIGFYTRLENVGQGIGRLLIAHLEAYAKSKGINTLQLAASPEGLTFYYKNGWEKIKDFIIEYNGVGFEETLMIKRVS